jgi:hypothetical protein
LWVWISNLGWALTPVFSQIQNSKQLLSNNNLLDLFFLCNDDPTSKEILNTLKEVEGLDEDTLLELFDTTNDDEKKMAPWSS